MTITTAIVEALLGYCKEGFCHGAGDNPSEDRRFCVQQAVNMATTDGEEETDGPDCIHDDIRSLGIELNDQDGWSSDKARAKGLKRFAVAELGTDDWEDSSQMVRFRKQFKERLGCSMSSTTHPLGGMAQDYFAREGQEDKQLSFVANTAADIMQELGSKGSKFLHLCDGKPLSRQKRVALARKECKKRGQLYLTKPEAARLAKPASFTGCGMKFNAGGFSCKSH